MRVMGVEGTGIGIGIGIGIGAGVGAYYGGSSGALMGAQLVQLSSWRPSSQLCSRMLHGRNTASRRFGGQ